MSKRSLVLTIEAHQPYVRHPKPGYEVENEWLFSAISDTYLPLLRLFSELESDGVPFRLAMAFSPSLCSMLTDQLLQERYVEWLERVILLGEQEVVRNAGNRACAALAERYLSDARRNYHDFVEIYEKNILSKFTYYVTRGNIELLATTATHCYLPLFQDLPEAVNAQIETGLVSHRLYFGANPAGFWLPEMGYAPGVEEALRGYGFLYSVLDTHGLLFAEPVASCGIFAPVKCSNGFVFFGNDSSARRDVSGEDRGFMFDSVYRNPARDVGFDSPAEDISQFLGKDKIRMASGYKYWNRSLNEKESSYDRDKAAVQASADAKKFLDERARRLASAAEYLAEGDPSLVCCLSADLLGQRWYEGVEWLGSMFRQAAERSDIRFDFFSEAFDSAGLLQKVAPFRSSSNGEGYAENLLDSSNDWMYRFIRKNIERMIDLAERFPDDSGLKERALNLAAKEVLLGMSDDWPQMLHDEVSPDYVRDRFKEIIMSFITVYDSLGSNFISTEWLTNREKECALFPQINYRIFRRKK